MNSHRRRGFTLIEVLLAIAVVAILAAIAIPSYAHWIRKAHRTEAKTAMLDLASREEKYFATRNAYTDDGTMLGYASAFPITLSAAGVATYTLTVQTTAAADGYAITAQPIGAQTADPCGAYQLDARGTPSVTGSASLDQCW